MGAAEEIRTPIENPLRVDGVRKEVRVDDETSICLLIQILDEIRVTNFYLAQIVGEELPEPDILKE